MSTENRDQTVSTPTRDETTPATEATNTEPPAENAGSGSDNEDEICPDCGVAHGRSGGGGMDLLEMLLGGGGSRSNYTVADEHKVARPQNDEFWQTLDKGPNREEYADLDFSTDDMDDIATAYTREWFTAVQSMTNMMVILGKLVEKYDLKSEDEDPDLPPGAKQIYESGSSMVKAEKALTSDKRIFFTLEAMRKDWGSISAFANAPESEREAWLKANKPRDNSNAMAMMMAMMMMGGGRGGGGGMGDILRMLGDN